MTIASEELAAIRVATVEENAKEVPIDPTDSDGKVLCIGSDLSPK
jgi:hypothetical protein